MAIFFNNGQRKQSSDIGQGKNKQAGSILIVVLWILVLLILLVTGLSRRGDVNMALSKLAVGQLRAQYLALSGIRYAAAIIEQDSKDELGSKSDTLYQCGVVLNDDLTLEKVFKHVSVPGGYFDIVPSLQRQDGQASYGFSDEESRINLNAVSAADFEVLKYLIMDAGFDQEKARTIAASVVDWVDKDNNPFQELYGHEKESADGSEAFVKNDAFQSLQELRLLKGMTPEIFEAIKNDLTVFPRDGGLAVNINTATPRALRSLVRLFTGNRTNTELSDADTLVEKILSYRRGFDGKDGTSDDRVVEKKELSLNSRENALMAQLEGYRVKVSQLLRLGVRGVDEQSGASFLAEAVLSRKDGKIMYWQRIR